MNRIVAGFAAVASLSILPAHAEIGRGPGPGRTSISIEGGYQKNDGAAVSSHGDLGAFDGDNPTTGAAAGVVSRPDGITSAIVTQAGEDGQIARIDQSGPGFIAVEASTGTPPTGLPSGNVGLSGVNELTGFVDAFVDVFSAPDFEEAFADAQGGDRTISARHGGFAALTFAYGFTKPVYGVFDRIEVYGSISRADESQRFDGAAGAVSVDGTSGFAAAAITPDAIPGQFVVPDDVDPTTGAIPGEVVTIGSVNTTVTQSVDFAEFGARLKADRWNYNSALFTAGLEGFYAIYSQDTAMRAFVGGSVGDFIGNNFDRTADVDSNMLGVLASFEGQVPIGGTPLSLIGRAFGGFYHLSAEGDFRDNFGVADVKDDHDGWGYRVGVEGGLRYDLTSSVSLSVTGAIDHFSEVATADLPQLAGERARVDTDDLTNYKVGARLTVTLGEEPAPFK